MSRILKAALAATVLCAPGLALAQPPAAAPAAPANPLVSPNPTYATIPMQIDVKAPADKVWARVGKFCDIGEWLQIAAGCKITSGKDGEIGAVRTVGGEVMVAKTDLSYSYAQPVRVGVPYNQYHGTVEVKAVTATTSKIIYSLVLDNSMLADDAARERDRANRATRFMGALRNMKTLAEGGTVTIAPPAAPAAAPAPR